MTAFAALQLLAAEVAVPDQELPRPVERVFPAGDVVLPTNAQLVAFGGNGESAFLLQRGDESVEQLGVRETLLASAGAAAFVLETPALLVGESIELQPSCPSCNAVFPFQVGDADDVTAPVIGDGEVRTYAAGIGGNGWFGAEGYEIDLCLPALTIDEPVLARLTGEGLTPLLLETAGGFCGDGPGLSLAFVLDGGEERAVCFEVVAIDVAGNESAPFPFCYDLVNDDAEGCAQTSSPTSMLLALTAFMLGRRRQSR